MADLKNTSSNIKITMSAIIGVMVALVFILIGIFVIDKFSITGADKSVEYWVSKVLTGCATFAIMISVANLCEESRKKRDTQYVEKINAVNSHYKWIMDNGASSQLEQFIQAINRANKYEAYIKMQRRKYNRTRNPKKRLKIEQALLATPDDVWSDVRYVRYHKVTYNLLVAGEYDINDKSDGYEMQVHKTGLVFKKLLIKAIAIIAFGWIAVDIGYSFMEFTKDMIVPLITKFVMILISAYSGVSFGYTVVDRSKNVLKNKLRIFSQFQTRVKDETVSEEGRFAVVIEKDAFVEKLKSQLEAKG